MFKTLSLAAALALLPLSAASADPQASPQSPSETALEAAAERFEARMEAFGERAEAIGDDESLTETQKGLRIAALWTEYSPDVEAFTAVATQHAGAIADEALANVDIDAIVTEALTSVEASGALASAQGIAANGAWASNDPEHMQTYGLVAQYALGEATDALDEATAELSAATVPATLAEPAPATAPAAVRED